MTDTTVLLTSFIIVMSIFAIVLLLDVFDSFKEDKAREEYKQAVVKSLEAKRKEREAFEQQAWEARKERFKAMGIV